MVPRLRRTTAAWTSRRTATATCGRGGCRRAGPATRATRSSPARTWTRYPTAARSTARSASCRRSPRSTSCATAAWCPTIPVAVVAFSDEEGARFGVACVGSQLSTGALSAERARGLRDNDGITLAEALTAVGRDPAHLGADPHLVERVGVFVELHVEQGRALDLVDAPHRRGVGDLAARPLGVHLFAARPTTRAPPAWSTGAIPMLAFASSVHAARAAGRRARRRRHVRQGAASRPTAPTPFRPRSGPGWTPGPPTRRR